MFANKRCSPPKCYTLHQGTLHQGSGCKCAQDHLREVLPDLLREDRRGPPCRRIRSRRCRGGGAAVLCAALASWRRCRFTSVACKETKETASSVFIQFILPSAGFLAAMSLYRRRAITRAGFLASWRRCRLRSARLLQPTHPPAAAVASLPGPLVTALHTALAPPPHTLPSRVLAQPAAPR